MPRHDGSSRERTRKQRKRRGRNGQSWHDLQPEPVLTRKQREREYERQFRRLARLKGWRVERSRG